MDAKQKMIDRIQKNYQRKIKLFEKIEPPKDVVLVGDSMVAYLNPSLYNLLDITLQGIAGDTTKGVKERLNLIYRLNPKKVILSIGSNDLVILNETPKKVAENILSLAYEIEKETHAKVYVLSMTPVIRDHDISNPLYISTRTNEMLEEINNMLSQTLNHDVFIDLYHDLIDENDNLNPSFSTDGIHLNQKGYEIYTKYIKDILSK